MSKLDATLLLGKVRETNPEHRILGVHSEVTARRSRGRKKTGRETERRMEKRREWREREGYETRMKEERTEREQVLNTEKEAQDAEAPGTVWEHRVHQGLARPPPQSNIRRISRKLSASNTREPGRCAPSVWCQLGCDDDLASRSAH